MSLSELFGNELLTELKEKAPEAFDKLEKKVGDKKLMLNDGSYIPKGKFDEGIAKAKAEADSYKTQLEDLESKVKALEPAGKDAAKLREELEKIKTESEAAKAELAEKLSRQAKDFAIESALAGAGAKNAKAVKALLDLDKISLDGENLVGLSEQLETVKKENDFLFGDTRVTGPPKPKGDDPNPDIEFTREQVEAMDEKTVRANLPAIEKSMRNWGG